MRTTLDLPQDLVGEALRITHSRTKTMAIKIALQNLIRQDKIKGLKDYRGKIKLVIDMNALRHRCGKF